MSGTPADGPHSASHRVVADHLRASAFLIADGVMPSNEGRGYVLRRIMRRAMRHAHLMGCTEPLMWRLVPTLVREMSQAFGELIRAAPLITETLKLEETRFKETLARGLRLLDDATAGLAEGGSLPGETAFKLYDTYGFPLDLTEDALRAQGRTVERAGFEACMERQREAARRAWAGSGDAASDAVWFGIRERVGATEFLGYGTESAEGVVQALVAGGAEVTGAASGDSVALVVNQTPFYAEAGGQVGDTGSIVTAEGARLRVTDTRREADGLHVHHAAVEEGTISVDDAVVLAVDGARRAALRANHSATHLLHAALRRALGDHVTQKGSLVAPDRLRFDISHPGAVSADELDDIESEVNRLIRRNAPLVTRLMSPEEATDAGALALFGEKYGEEVRVVSMGGNENGADAPYSVELCGGTHVERTGDIGLFRIVSESASAAGIRRIEALTGEAARRHGVDLEAALREAAAVLKVPPSELAGRIGSLVDEHKKLERTLEGDPPRACHRGRRGHRGRPRHRRGRLRRPLARRGAAQGAARHGGRPEEPHGLGRLRRGEPDRRQGRAHGRRQRRPHRPPECGRSRARGRGGGRRQGRGRPGRHGAGRRPRRRAPGRRAQGHREGAGGRRLSVGHRSAPAATARRIGGAAIPAILPSHE